MYMNNINCTGFKIFFFQITQWRLAYDGSASMSDTLYTRVSYNIFDGFKIEMNQLILITRLSYRGKIDVFDKLKCH